MPRWAMVGGPWLAVAVVTCSKEANETGTQCRVALAPVLVDLCAMPGPGPRWTAGGPRLHPPPTHPLTAMRVPLNPPPTQVAALLNSKKAKLRELRDQLQEAQVRWFNRSSCSTACPAPAAHDAATACRSATAVHPPCLRSHSLALCLG